MPRTRTFCDTSAVFSRALPADARDRWCRINIQRENQMHVPLTVRKLLLGFVVVLVVCLAAYLRFHHSKPVLEVAYAGNRQVILWDSSAEIREAIGTLKYGDRLDVLDHFQQQTKVRTPIHQIGWVAQSDLMSVDLWQKMQDLEAMATASPVEARGSTRVISNLHIVPGRESPRLRQISKGIPVELFERQAVEVPARLLRPRQRLRTATTGTLRVRLLRRGKRIGGWCALIWPIRRPWRAGFSADSWTSMFLRRFRTTPAPQGCESRHGSS